MKTLLKSFLALSILVTLPSWAVNPAYSLFSPNGALDGDWQYQYVKLDAGAYITGALPLAKLEVAAANQLLLSNGSSWGSVSVPTCADSMGQHLNYSTGSSTFSCGTTAASSSLAGTTGSIGGGLLAVGGCTSGTATVTGATTSMVAVSEPSTFPGNGNTWMAQVTAPDTVTVRLCAMVLGTPTASVYKVRVIP